MLSECSLWVLFIVGPGAVDGDEAAEFRSPAKRTEGASLWVANGTVDAGVHAPNEAVTSAPMEVFQAREQL